MSDDDNWFELDDAPKRAARAWQNGRTGLVMVLERMEHGDKWQLVLFPENFHEDADPVKHYGPYQERGKALDRAAMYRSALNDTGP